MTLLFHTVHLLYRPAQEEAFPSVPRDSASLEELRTGAKRAVTCGGRRRKVGGRGVEARLDERRLVKTENMQRVGEHR